MKILDVSSYNEKLKINPVSLDDFKKINIIPIYQIYTKYKKKDLKTGDVCQIIKESKIGVVILQKDHIDMAPYELSIIRDESFIMFYNPYKLTIWSYIKLDSYDDSLKVTSGHTNCNVCRVVADVTSLETLKNPNELAKQLENIKLFLRENN